MIDKKTENTQTTENTSNIISEINIPVTFLNKQAKVYEYKIQELKKQHKREINYWKKNFLSCLISLVAVTIVTIVIIIIYTR